MAVCENILVSEKNRGGYTLSVVAQFRDYGPVVYVIRVETPKGESSEYVSSLDGFKKFGELLLDLHEFAEEKLYAKEDKEKLKEILTAENIKTYVAFKKVGKFKK